MYNILYLAYIEPKYKQLHTKINGQVEALKELGHTVSAFIIGRNYPADFPFNPNFKIMDTAQTAEKRHEIVVKLIEMTNPDMIYFRYPNGYKNVLEPLIPVLKKYPKVIFEHNTREEDELEHNQQWEILEQEKSWGRQLITYAKGLVGCFPSATQHQIERAPDLKIPTITIGNGLKVADYPEARQPVLEKELNVLFSGYIARHHGLERAFAGIYENPELNINLYIVGKFFDKDYEQASLTLVDRLNLNNKVHFLGELNKQELNPWFDKCHICIGSLGMHRLSTKDGASLKTREYLSRGKAIIMDHEDPDLSPDLSFIYRIQGDESPLDFKDIYHFIKNADLSPQIIREYALQHCDWKGKMQRLVNFMESCIFPAKQIVTTKNIPNQTKDQYTVLLTLNDDYDANYLCLQALTENTLFDENTKLIILKESSTQRNNYLIGCAANFAQIISITSPLSPEEKINKFVTPDRKTIDLNNTFRAYPNWLEQQPVLEPLPETISNNDSRAFCNRQDFDAYQLQCREERLAVERYFATQNLKNEQFFSVGYCEYCHQPVNFMIDWILNYDNVPGYRERLICPVCGMSARKRMVASHLIKQTKNLKSKPKVFCFEQKSKFFKMLLQDHGSSMDLIGSEYLEDNIASGTIVNGLRHEDASNLSFQNSELDFILSNDVFEHVPDIHKAISECYRVLKKGGKLIFTIPFRWDQDKTFARATIENGVIKHLTQPHYHKDPLRKEGSLVFYEYGWDLLEFLKSAGFKAYIKDYYDFLYGYYGDAMNLLFIAEK